MRASTLRICSSRSSALSGLGVLGGVGGPDLIAFWGEGCVAAGPWVDRGWGCGGFQGEGLGFWAFGEI